MCMSSGQNWRKTKQIGSGLGMFEFVWKPSQPTEDHPLWPCPLRVVCHQYVILFATDINVSVGRNAVLLVLRRIYIYIHLYLLHDFHKIKHRKKNMSLTWLVVWLPFFIFPLILGCDYHPNWLIFFRGVVKKTPTRLCWSSIKVYTIAMLNHQRVESSMMIICIRWDTPWKPVNTF